MYLETQVTHLLCFLCLPLSTWFRADRMSLDFWGWWLLGQLLEENHSFLVRSVVSVSLVLAAQLNFGLDGGDGAEVFKHRQLFVHIESKAQYIGHIYIYFISLNKRLAEFRCRELPQLVLNVDAFLISLSALISHPPLCTNHSSTSLH